MRTIVCVLALQALVVAQAEIRPAREFVQFRGTWKIDQTAGRGRIAGLPIARTLVIVTNATEMSVAKDAGDPEVYRIDGAETVEGERRRSLTLVADALALTNRRTRYDRGYALTNVITDAYTVSGDTLTVERQLSVAVAALASPDSRTPGNYGPGHLVELEDPGSNRQTIVYRRQR